MRPRSYDLDETIIVALPTLFVLVNHHLRRKCGLEVE